jgi:hypothetical protein
MSQKSVVISIFYITATSVYKAKKVAPPCPLKGFYSAHSRQPRRMGRLSQRKESKCFGGMPVACPRELVIPLVGQICTHHGVGVYGVEH